MDFVPKKTGIRNKEVSRPWDMQKEKTKQRKKQMDQAEIDFCVYHCPIPDRVCRYGDCKALRDFKKTL